MLLGVLEGEIHLIDDILALTLLFLEVSKHFEKVDRCLRIFLVFRVLQWHQEEQLLKSFVSKKWLCELPSRLVDKKLLRNLEGEMVKSKGKLILAINVPAVLVSEEDES